MPNGNNISAGLRVGYPHYVGETPACEESAPVTFSIGDVAEQLGAPSERWVIDQIRSGRFPARKIGRAWRMTERDIRDALEVCGNTLCSSVETAAPIAGMTPTSRR